MTCTQIVKAEKALQQGETRKLNTVLHDNENILQLDLSTYPPLYRDAVTHDFACVVELLLSAGVRPPPQPIQLFIKKYDYGTL